MSPIRPRETLRAAASLLLYVTVAVAALAVLYVAALQRRTDLTEAGRDLRLGYGLLIALAGAVVAWSRVSLAQAPADLARWLR